MNWTPRVTASRSRCSSRCRGRRCPSSSGSRSRERPRRRAAARTTACRRPPIATSASIPRCSIARRTCAVRSNGPSPCACVGRGTAAPRALAPRPGSCATCAARCRRCGRSSAPRRVEALEVLRRGLRVVGVEVQEAAAPADPEHLVPAAVARLTNALMHGFRPGTSPPPVSTPSSMAESVTASARGYDPPGRSGGTGRRAGLKIPCPSGRVGSIPTSGIERKPCARAESASEPRGPRSGRDGNGQQNGQQAHSPGIPASCPASTRLATAWGRSRGGSMHVGRTSGLRLVGIEVMPSRQALLDGFSMSPVISAR